MIKKTKLPFGLTSDGRMVAVDQVASGLACECICPQCKAQLIAAKGEVYIHHFRHYVDIDCVAARETALHKFAKQTIAEHGSLLVLPPLESIPQLGELKGAAIEKSIGEIRPDVVLEFEAESIAVEVFVAHAVEMKKVRKYASAGVAAIEIQLGDYRFCDDRSSDQWSNLILREAYRYWLFPPRDIRDERERQRQHEIEVQRTRMIAAANEMRRLDAIRLAQIDERDKANAQRALQRQEVAALDEADRLDREIEIARRADEREALRSQYLRLFEAPDLHAMIRAHGSYSNIPGEAWEDFDDRCRKWQAAMRAGTRYDRTVMRLIGPPVAPLL